MAFDHGELRRAFGSFPSGVAALCAFVDGAPAGMAASSFTSVSLEPPLVSLCVAHSSTTWPRLAHAERLGLSVLAEGQGELCRALAAQGVDRFADVDYQVSADGALFLSGAALILDLSRRNVLVAGDHDIVVFEVCGFTDFPTTAPLVFHRSRMRSLTLDA